MNYMKLWTTTIIIWHCSGKYFYHNIKATSSQPFLLSPQKKHSLAPGLQQLRLLERWSTCPWNNTTKHNSNLDIITKAATFVLFPDAVALFGAHRHHGRIHHRIFALVAERRHPGPITKWDLTELGAMAMGIWDGMRPGTPWIGSSWIQSVEHNASSTCPVSTCCRLWNPWHAYCSNQRHRSYAYLTFSFQNGISTTG